MAVSSRQPRPSSLFLEGLLTSPCLPCRAASICTHKVWGLTCHILCAHVDPSRNSSSAVAEQQATRQVGLRPRSAGKQSGNGATKVAAASAVKAWPLFLWER